MPIMARIRLAWIAFTKLQTAIFGTRRVPLESRKIAYISRLLSLLLYGSECWVVNAENLRLLQQFHRKCIRIMCRVARRHTRKHCISTDEPRNAERCQLQLQSCWQPCAAAHAVALALRLLSRFPVNGTPETRLHPRLCGVPPAYLDRSCSWSAAVRWICLRPARTLCTGAFVSCAHRDHCLHTPYTCSSAYCVRKDCCLHNAYTGI